MAGLLHRPKLFVYHVENSHNFKLIQVFETMERKLLSIIMAPACVATLVSGLSLTLILGLGSWTSGWFHLKLVFVLGLGLFHGLMDRYWKQPMGRHLH